MNESRPDSRTPEPVRAVPGVESVLPGEAFDLDALALAERSAGIGVWSIDLATGHVRATAQFFRIMGLEPTREPVPIESIRALRHPDDRERVLAGFREALEGGTDAYEIEYRILRPDGELRWIFGRGRIVRDHNGTPTRYSGVDLDITERKAAEAALAAAKEELERMNLVLEDRVRQRTAALAAEAERRAEAEARYHQAQKMEAVGQLTGGIAHDFNNILQVILGNLEIARLALECDPTLTGSGVAHQRLLGALERAHRSSASAQQLVQRLLAFGRKQTLAPTMVDANALIGGMEDMIGRTLGETIAVRTSLGDGLWPVFADVNQLESALLNLVVNARHAMPDGGRLALETANVELPASAAEGIIAGSYVMLAVSDTGCGIPKELLSRVFEPFFSTKASGEGSGLGLSMVFGFVKQSGGHLRIYSEVGVGTTVKIYLPRCVEATSATDPSRDPVEPTTLPSARDGETVLVVEDNDDVRAFGVSALERLGYKVLQAADGPAALHLLERAPAPRVDLLFSDVVLPGAMSGRALAEAVRARRAALPIVFASGYTLGAIRQQGAIEAGLRLLAKPYTLEDLALAVRRAIDGAAPG
jgi:PAS domain S-box-containing protein